LIDTEEKPKEKRSKSAIGKASRARGKLFELSVRKDLEANGWIICKWTNTVLFDENGEGKIVGAKSKYNPFLKRVISEGSGLPDFVGIRHGIKHREEYVRLFDVIGIESKTNIKTGLDKKEKQMCAFYLDKGVFSNIYIAHPVKEGRKNKVVYQNFSTGEEFNVI
jgi:hypothetical protein